MSSCSFLIENRRSKREEQKQLANTWFFMKEESVVKILPNQIKNVAIAPSQPYQNLKKIAQKILLCSSPTS